MSSALTPGTPAAHQLQIRQLITSLQQHPPIFPKSPPPFHALTHTTLPPLLSSLRSTLRPDATLVPSLSLLISLLSCAPLSVLSPNIPSIYHDLEFFLRSPHKPITRARVLAIVAQLLRVQKPSSHNPSPVLRAALSQASKALQATYPQLQLSALAIFLVALQSAPQELRRHLRSLNQAIPLLFAHPHPQLSHAAATLYAHMLISFDHSRLQSEYETRLAFLTDRLDDIHHLLDQFAGLNRGLTTRHVHADIQAFELSQMVPYYTSICTVLKAQLSISAKVHLPVAVIFHSVMRGFAHRQFDPFTSVNGTKLDVDAAIELCVVVNRQSLVALCEVLRKLGRQLLPFAEIIAAAVERKLVRTLLCFRAHGGSVQLEERVLLYQVVDEGIRVFGGAFFEHFLPVFVDLFEVEVAFHSTSLEAAQPRERKVSVLEVGRKRLRRNQRGTEQQPKQTDGDTQEKKVLGVTMLSKVRRALEEGLNVCISIFDNRGLINKKGVEAMERLEAVLSSMADGEISDQVLQALSAAALGGGSCRLRAEASPLLFKCARLSTALALEYNSRHKKAAMQARSACEAVFHSRGTPIMKHVPGMAVEQVDGAVPKSAQRSVINAEGSSRHDSVPMLVDSANEGIHDNSLPVIRPPTSTLGNGSVPSRNEGEALGDMERSGANPSKPATMCIRDDPNASKREPGRNMALSRDPVPHEPGKEAAAAGTKKNTSDECAQAPQVDTVEPKAGRSANENRGGPTTVQNEGTGREEQNVTLDADEEALIASLRFEASDEE